MISIFALSLLTLPFQDETGRGPVLAPFGSHPYRVSSASMEPTFKEGDVVIANRPRGDCGQTQPRIGDVVIQMNRQTPYIARVIAGPGQTVQMISGRLYIDGAVIPRELADSLCRDATQRRSPSNSRLYHWTIQPVSPLVRTSGSQWATAGTT